MKRFAIILAVVVLHSGCSTTEPSEAQGRLSAALALENDTARHNALLRCAEFAAEQGDAAVVATAISKVKKETARNNLGLTCSQSLAKCGKTAEATKIAQSIEDETMRRNALSDIAKGE